MTSSVVMVSRNFLAILAASSLVWDAALASEKLSQHKKRGASTAQDYMTTCSAVYGTFDFAALPQCVSVSLAKAKELPYGPPAEDPADKAGLAPAPAATSGAYAVLCDVCSRHFATLDSFRGHLRTAHPGQIIPNDLRMVTLPLSAGMLPCEICHRDFASLESKRAHVRRMHPEHYRPVDTRQKFRRDLAKPGRPAPAVQAKRH